LKQITSEKISTMRKLQQEMISEADPDRWSKLNNDFHLALYQREGAARLLMVIEMLRNWVAGYVRLLVSDPEHRRLANADHARILKAVESRNAKRLRAAIDDHLRTSCDGVVSSLWNTALANHIRQK
jgi:DNA-binding GntR family transcriptional regulator